MRHRAAHGFIRPQWLSNIFFRSLVSRAVVGRLPFAGKVRAVMRAIVGRSRHSTRIAGVFYSVELHALQSLFLPQKSLSPCVPESGTGGYTHA